jgi:hypothetical protein
VNWHDNLKLLDFSLEFDMWARSWNQRQIADKRQASVRWYRRPARVAGRDRSTGSPMTWLLYRGGGLLPLAPWVVVYGAVELIGVMGLAVIGRLAAGN